MEKTRRYDQEFKSGAVDLANKSDKPIAQIVRELGIKPSLLYSWLKEKRKPKEVGIAMAHLQTQEAEINVRIRGGLNPWPLGEDLSMVFGYGELW